jgi:hypothetical protein
MNQRHQTDSRNSKSGLGWAIGLSIVFAVAFVALGFVAGSMGYQAPRAGDNRLGDFPPPAGLLCFIPMMNVHFVFRGPDFLHQNPLNLVV